MKEKFIRFFDYVCEYNLYALILFIPISSAAIESFFGFTFLFFLLKKIIQPDFKFLKTSTHLFLLFFILFMGLSLFNSSPYIMKSLKALFFKWLEYILIFIMTQDILCNSKRVRNCLIILLSVAALICIDALFQRFMGIDFLRHKITMPLYPGARSYAITATFHHYNDFGAYLVFNLPFVLVLLISIKNRLHKSALFLLVLLLLVCLILSYSRGALLGFISAIILMLFLFPKEQKSVYIFTTLVILIMIFIPGLKERIFFGDSGRYLIWKDTLKMIREHPFLGIGLGTFMDYYRKYILLVGNIQYAHNCYLQIWAETGVFALLSFILFIGSILYKAIKAFNNNCNFVLLGFICALFGFLVHSFFDTQLYSLQLAALFWFMSGFVVVLTKVDTSLKVKEAY